jgi:hypothetical protein
MNHTETGALAGGAVGTGVGAALGAITHHPVAGAAVGGVTGAVLGGAAGADRDAQDRARDIQQAQAVGAAQAQQQRMGITDVVHMAQQGHDDQVIINQIRATGSTFQLSGSDLDFLKNNGVSPRVIAEMQTARPTPSRVYVREAPPPAVVFERPYYYPPPPAVFIAPRPYYWGPRYCR